MLLSDTDLRKELDSGRLVLDPWDPAMLQPSSVDVRLDRYFRVFKNSRYTHIDPSQQQDELTTEVEPDGDDPFVLHPGEFVSFYLTGLGQTTRRADGLDWASATPTVTIGGVECSLQFAGASPVYPGLDQVNCKLPADIAPNATATVVVSSSGRSSNATTIPIQ